MHDRARTLRARYTQERFLSLLALLEAEHPATPVIALLRLHSYPSEYTQPLLLAMTFYPLVSPAAPSRPIRTCPLLRLPHERHGHREGPT